MARRTLSSEDEALWNALTRSVRPLRPGARRIDLPVSAVATKGPSRLMPPPSNAPVVPPSRVPSTVLDSGWERRIRGGTLTPDMSVDLHGHSLSAAHARLNQLLATALARGARVLLVVTGKPPRTEGAGRASHRGAIRSEIGHWLETTPYADRIASVRVAHPRHGGEGAIYVILRRKK